MSFQFVTVLHEEAAMQDQNSLLYSSIHGKEVFKNGQTVGYVAYIIYNYFVGRSRSNVLYVAWCIIEFCASILVNLDLSAPRRSASIDAGSIKRGPTVRPSAGQRPQSQSQTTH